MPVLAPYSRRHGAQVSPQVLQDLHVRARHGLTRLLRQERATLRLRSRQSRPAPSRLRHQGDTGESRLTNVTHGC